MSQRGWQSPGIEGSPQHKEWKMDEGREVHFIHPGMFLETRSFCVSIKWIWSLLKRKLQQWATCTFNQWVFGTAPPMPKRQRSQASPHWGPGESVRKKLWYRSSTLRCSISFSCILLYGYAGEHCPVQSLLWHSHCDIHMPHMLRVWRTVHVCEMVTCTMAETYH